jgi:hypothetical protein
VSRAMRIAVDNSGRSVKEMDQSEAARRGCLRALKRIRARAMSAHAGLRHNNSWKGFPAIAREAAPHGRLEVLKWANLMGKEDLRNEYHHLVDFAAKGGHLETLKWMYGLNWPWDQQTCAEAAEGGHFSLLKWLREKGCPWSDRTCAFAAYGGHLEILKWARENDCPWDEDTCTYAAEGGHLEVLKWARSNDCPWPGRNRLIGCAANHPAIVEWLEEHA